MKKLIIAGVFLGMALTGKSQFFIQGAIKDEAGNALAGVAVQEVNTVSGTATDVEGNYKLGPLAAGKHQVTARFLGYEPQTRLLEINETTSLNFTLKLTSFMTDEVLVQSTRLGKIAVGTSSTISKQTIAGQNLGQDLPYMMSLTPSMVTTSDAGTGVGYTSFRIRGADGNRINVTVNGIPLNDAESHGVFWVNMPDFASSIENIEIQRGVGTSTNGAGAFGATVNMQTSQFERQPYAEISSATGSFNTFKNSVKVGSGLLKDHFVVEARLSKIKSDGYIDRSFSDLTSWYVSGGYYSEKTLVKANVFSGKEKTYQAWNGVPKVRLENDTAGMLRYGEHWLYSDQQVQEMLNSNSRTYNLYTYENETDNYQQDHYQLFFSQDLRIGFSVNAALHYTYGRGYYEQYKTDDKLGDYGIPDIILGQDTVTNSDIIRQKWMDNDFYGAVASFQYKNKRITATIGGGVNQYDGRHFGKVIWGQYLGDISHDYEWYRSTGSKLDANIYQKAVFEATPKLRLFGDIQYRFIVHDMVGIDDNYRDITQQHTFKFFNPKAGINFHPFDGFETYFMYANGHREPNRSNFTDAGPNQPIPKAESLNDFELGAKYQHPFFIVGGNIYYMDYKDQLVLTGQINDVGSSIMANVDKSYRLGIEILVGVKIGEIARWDANFTFSDNRIIDFNEYVDDWDNGGQQINHLGDTKIAFSPDIVANSLLTVYPIKNFEIGFTTQLVGKQYIDNSMSNDRMLDQYCINNLRLTYSLKSKWFEQINFNLMVNNLFDVEYENNAWVYSYIYEGQRWAMDGYFPQAGINFLTGIDVKF